MQYDNNLKGVLFVNDKKENAEDKKPNMTGSCEINGKEYWVSAWKRTGTNSGKTFLSLSFQSKEQDVAGDPNNRPVAAQESDGLPF
tara:strand:- start:235 stop:492 length:258 start_codon:yes stop_codon:yes gene_type:complete